MKKKIAIVGSGIVGVSTAIWALREGHDVTLIDREGPAAGTSYGNGGVLASCSVVPVSTPGLARKAPGMLLDPNQPLFMKWRYVPKLVPYLIKFLKHANADSARARAEAMLHIIGDSLNDHLALAGGSEAERYIKPTDYLFLYDDRKHYESDSFGWNVRRDLGFVWDELEGESFHAYEPAFADQIQFAARLKDHGIITDPGEYVKTLAKVAQSKGARVIKAEVSDVIVKGGQVTGLRAQGETIECDVAVVAAGVWSGPLAKKLGIKVPLETERGYHLELWEPNIVPRAPVMVASGKFVITPMDGRLRMAGIVEFGGLSAPPSKAPIELLKRNAAAAIPGLTWKHTQEWMGHRPAVADSTPVIGEIDGLSGAYVGFGHDHVGLTGGPKTGRLLAQLISGQKPNIDMRPYSPARFAN